MDIEQSKVSSRYSDEELIGMLQSWVMDYNKLPTQREMLADDRMPTHHTYINRFGSLKKAAEIAGMGKVKDGSALHKLVAEYLKDKIGADKVHENDSVGGLLMDFVLELSDGLTAVDIVDISKFEVPAKDIGAILGQREYCAKSFGLNYIRIGSLVDLPALYELVEAKKWQ